MSRKRRVHTEKFKAKVGLEAIKGIKTTSELATEYKIHANQINEWKKKIIEGSSELFSRGNKDTTKSNEELTGPLYEEIGRLKMDLKWLEKKL